MSTITGWRTAAKHVGDTVSPMKLRTMVKHGTLRAVKTAAGTYEFDVADLEALRATLAPAARLPKYPAASVPGAATASAAPTGAASPSASMPAAMGSGTLPDFMARAVEQRAHGDHVDVTDEDEHDGDDHDADTDQPSCAAPFWAAGVAPVYNEGEPVIDPVTYRISYRPPNANMTGTHAPGTAGAVIEELRQQLAATQAQLAAATATAEQWRTAWRAARTAAIAGTIMSEAAHAGASPMSVDAAWRAAGAAADALHDDQLANELHAMGVARAAGSAAAMRAVGAVLVGQGAWDGDHDLARARERRRSRSPRW